MKVGGGSKVKGLTGCQTSVPNGSEKPNAFFPP